MKFKSRCDTWKSIFRCNTYFTNSVLMLSLHLRPVSAILEIYHFTNLYKTNANRLERYPNHNVIK